MAHERMKSAKHFVGCPKWEWLRGMTVRSGTHPSERWMFDGEWWVSDEGDRYQLPDPCAPASLILGVTKGPDLDDPVTMAATLVVVRKAWDDETISTVCQDGDTGEPQFWDVVRSSGRVIASDASEDAALAASLKDAPR